MCDINDGVLTVDFIINLDFIKIFVAEQKRADLAYHISAVTYNKTVV